MPFDTNVAQPDRLQLQMPPMPDPLDAATKILTLRNLTQQGQTQAAQLQGLQMENQQRQLQLHDQQYLSTNLPKMYSDPQYQDQQGNVDFGKIARAVAPNVSLATAQSMYKGVLENQKSVAEITKARADTSKTNQEIQANDGDMLAGAASRWKTDANGNYNTAAIGFDLDQFQRSHPEYGPQLEQLRQHLSDNPDQIEQTVNGIMGGAKADRTRANAIALDAQNTAARLKATMPGLISDEEAKQKGAIAGTLANSRNSADYQQNLSMLNARANDPANPNPGAAPQIPFDPQSLFDQNGNWKPQAQQYVRNWGLTDEQQQSAINAAKVRTDAEAAQAGVASGRAETARHDRVVEGQGQDRIDNSTAAQNQAVQQQLSRALADDTSHSPANALRNVQQFYQNDDAMDAVRGKVVTALQNMVNPPKGSGGANGALATLAAMGKGKKPQPAQASGGNAAAATPAPAQPQQPNAVPSASDYINNLQKRRKQQ